MGEGAGVGEGVGKDVGVRVGDGAGLAHATAMRANTLKTAIPK